MESSIDNAVPVNLIRGQKTKGTKLAARQLIGLQSWGHAYSILDLYADKAIVVGIEDGSEIFLGLTVRSVAPAVDPVCEPA